MLKLRGWSRFALAGVAVVATVRLAVTVRLAHADSIDSTFFVDGLAVDKLDRVDAIDETEVYRGGLPRFPLVEERKRPGRFSALLQSEPTDKLLPPVGTQERLARAEQHISRGEWNQARLIIEEELEKAPANLYLLRRAAALAAAAGKYGVADGYFRRCVQADPENVPYLVGWAGVLIRLYRFDEAQALVEKALGLDPQYLSARFHQAILRVLRSDIQGLDREWENTSIREIEDLSGWLIAHHEDLVPVMSEEAYTLLCDLTLGTGTQPHLEEIRSKIRAAISASRQARWPEAAAAYEEMKKLGVRSYAPEMHRAIAFSESGDNERAFQILEALVQRYPEEDGLLYNLGYLSLRDQRYDEAVRIFQTLHERSPASGEFAFALACAYAAKGQMDAAWSLLTELAQKHPDRMENWLKGEAPYLRAIREDDRFPQLMALWQAPRLSESP